MFFDVLNLFIVYFSKFNRYGRVLLIENFMCLCAIISGDFVLPNLHGSSTT